MLQPKRSGISRYILALISVGVILIISVVLHSVLATAPIFLLLVPVAFSAWYGGLGPGLFATVITTIVASYFFQEPLYSFHVSFNDFLVLCIFAVSAFFISSLSEAQMRAEEKVRESEARFQLLLENVKDYALIFLDPGGYITDWNTGTERLFGYHENEIVGQNFSKFFTPEDVQAGIPANELKQAITRGSGNDERWHIRKDNSRFWSVGITTPLYDQGGKLRGFAKVARDYTEQKLLTEQLENERSLLEAVIQSIPDAIYIGDQHAVWKCNAAAAKMLGCENPQDFKQDATSIVQKIQARYAESGVAMPATDQPFFHALKGATVIRDMLVRQFKTGRDLIIRCAAAPIRDANGKIIGAVAVNTDITERRRMEKELQSLNKQLESHVAERTAELEASIKELEGFSYSISHDLRAPLRAINGFANIMLADNKDRLTSEEQKYIETMRDNALRMGHLIDDLLDFIRLSRKPLHREPVCSKMLVQEALDELQPDYEGRRVEFSIDDLPTANADRVMLKLVFICLLSNAVKFTRNRDVARIEVGTQEADDCIPTYFIKDNGIGFDMQYSEKIFGVFQQLNPAEAYEGTGVGLAVAQRIIRRHGGRIWAESQPDQGATFYFTLDSCAQ